MRSISIVTPCYNAVDTIDETIWSVVSQGNSLHICYHIQDGYSTDGTQSKLVVWENKIHLYQEILPSKIEFSWSSEKDSGMYDALAKGFSRLSIAEDHFMGWINAGDIFWPGALEAVTSFAQEHPRVDWLTGIPTARERYGAITVIPHDHLYPREILAAGLADGVHHFFLQQESTFWRKRLYDKAGGLKTSFQLAGDWDLWRRFAQQVPVVHMQRQLGVFTSRPGQLSSDLRKYLREMEENVTAERRAVRMKALEATIAKYSVVSTDRDADGHWIVGEAAIKPAELAHPQPLSKNNYFLKIPHYAAKKAPLFTRDFDANEVTYARASHMKLLLSNYISGVSGEFDSNFCDLKAFQDALCTAFIDQTLQNNSKILEVGGGNSRVLSLFQDKHECWNIDKFEGIGNGPQNAQQAKYKTCLAYMGEKDNGLPENYFDLVFSLSSLEHVPEDKQVFKNIVDDIQRVLKVGGWSIHLLDIINKDKNDWWMNGIVDYIFKNITTLNTWIHPEKTAYADEIFFMSKNYYDVAWKKITKEEYDTYGMPTSICIIWKK